MAGPSRAGHFVGTRSELLAEDAGLDEALLGRVPAVGRRGGRERRGLRAGLGAVAGGGPPRTGARPRGGGRGEPRRAARGTPPAGGSLRRNWGVPSPPPRHTVIIMFCVGGTPSGLIEVVGEDAPGPIPGGCRAHARRR